MTAPAEPPDHHVYNRISFNRDAFEFYRAAVAFYESLLRRDLEAVKTDVDLRAILGDRRRVAVAALARVEHRGRSM